MIDNSGGIVVGATMCRIECSRFKSRFILIKVLVESLYIMRSLQNNYET